MPHSHNNLSVKIADDWEGNFAGKETGKIFPIDPNSSLLDGISVDEIFKGKKKAWEKARNKGRNSENPKNDTEPQKDTKSSHKPKNN